MKKTAAFILAFVLFAALAVPAFADGNATYTEDADKFIFAPGSKYSPTDMFDGSFKGLMPGDTATEQIVVKNDLSKTKLKVYMRSLGAQQNTDDFLSQLKLSVKAVGGAELFEAPSDQTAGLTDWVLLGTFNPGGAVTLDVKVEVPIELDAKYMNDIGYIDWQFAVEKIPVTTPTTGDSSSLGALTALFALSAVCSSAALLLLKKEH